MRGIRRPTPHPRRWAYDVVRASYRLAAEAKHVWRIINEFDTSAGCWAAPSLLAQLTGLPLDTFNAHVEMLLNRGLLTQVQQGTRRILFAALPADMPTDAELERQDKLLAAQRLDRHLAESRLTPPAKRDKGLPKNEGDCSPASSSPAVTTVTASSPAQASPANGNGGYPGGVSELAASLGMPAETDEEVAAASRRRWKERSSGAAA
jgi:hypothetical protein